MKRRDFVQTCAGVALTASLSQAEPETMGSVVGPKSKPPARHLCAFRMEELPFNVRDLRLTLHCLQGLVNREQPRLYLVQDRYDELWLDWLRERGDVDEVEWIDIGKLFECFLPVASCMYVTDPAIPASVNVATMLAGVHNAVVATPGMAGMFNLSMGADPDSNKVGADLRVMHWRKDVEAYRWAFAQIGDSLSRKAVAYLDPTTDAVRDYFVEFKIPIVWVSNPNDQTKPHTSFFEERDLAREVFMKWPPNIPCMGWPLETGIGEWEGVRLASECAKFEVCSGHDGYSPTVSNLSVHSGTTATLRQRPPAAPKLERDKIYYAFVRSDGDGLNFQRHYYRKLFDDPQHGRVPLGWHIGPTAADFQPDILDYYYKHASPGDCFVNALTGVGYIHEDNYADNYPPEQREQIWREYIELSAAYRKRIDASVISTWRVRDLGRVPGAGARSRSGGPPLRGGVQLIWRPVAGRSWAAAPTVARALGAAGAGALLGEGALLYCDEGSAFCGAGRPGAPGPERRRPAAGSTWVGSGAQPHPRRAASLGYRARLPPQTARRRGRRSSTTSSSSRATSRAWPTRK